MSFASRVLDVFRKKGTPAEGNYASFDPLRLSFERKHYKGTFTLKSDPSIQARGLLTIEREFAANSTQTILASLKISLKSYDYEEILQERKQVWGTFEGVDPTGASTTLESGWEVEKEPTNQYEPPVLTFYLMGQPSEDLLNG
jgi:hypothetical protein